jgi:prepilin-type N-terminal cleavage/methylation domain-containing protein/prepilin-type processing-associated H-X9-DG protein
MRPPLKSGHHWHAFTLLELLVVLAIVGVLIGLLLPAVQKARDAAGRIKCATNLHQIGLAMHQYHDTMGSFPSGMRSPSSRDLPGPYASWLTMLLPYIEQGNLWNATVAAYRQSRLPFVNPPHIGLATVMPIFACPADPRADQVQLAPRDKIYVALTCYLGVEGQNLYSRDGVLFKDSAVRIADITDGTSNTLLAGERPASADCQFGWWYAGVGQLFTGSAEMVLGVREPNLQPVTKGSCPPGTYSYAPGSLTNQCDMFHFWSLHRGGAMFLFADGSVHFLPYAAVAVMPALASRAGGEDAGLPD